MAVASTHWRVASCESYAGGRSFGDAGPYLVYQGRVHYRVDPLAARNVGIVDLRLAPRDELGSVCFSGDFTLVAPRNGRAEKLLVDVPNRGRRLAFSMFNRASPTALNEDPCAPGDGFLFRRGFAVASIGWQWDVAAGLGLDAPEVLEGGQPVTGDVVCRMQPGHDRPSLPFGQLGEVTYPPTDREHPRAQLFVRNHDNAPLVEIPRPRWRFARQRGTAIEPSDRYVYLSGGFAKGRIYILVYRARGVRVTGCGLLALRDAAASLRRGEGPNGTGFRRVVGFGASQTGRALRHLLHLGLNTDGAGEQVFDGVHIHIAGGQRGDFNHRFAQPSSAGAPALGQRFPFAGTTVRDPLTGSEDGLYAHLRHKPKVVITNTSWEYWRGDAALTHVSPDGKCDLEADAQERNYLFAGTHHIGGILPPTNTFALTGEKARYTFNVVDHSPLVRAALVNLDAWLGGRSPPPSAVPTLAAGTLVERSSVLAKFARLNDFHGLDANRLGGLSRLDLGPGAEQGICRFPAEEGEPYVRKVSDVDDTLNETAGVRLPDVAVPVACHTGWNPRHPDNGATSLPAIFVGFTRFAKDLPSAEEYERRVRDWAHKLVLDRYVLTEDLERVVQNCLVRYRLAVEARDA